MRLYTISARTMHTYIIVTVTKKLFSIYKVLL
jgi:hypothetical protein